MIPIAKPIISEKEKQFVKEVLDSGMLVQGPKVKEFEKKFAELCGTKYAIATNSGTAAIHSSLYSIGVKHGDEVITSPFTFVASANPIIMQRGKVIFADIKEDTFNIDPESIKNRLTAKTKAIIAVDLYGQVADYEKIKEVINGKDIKVIEDACQAVNASLDGEKAGSFGDCAAFSFYATKNMITGEGGILTTNNGEYAELAKRFRHHGQSEKTRYEYYDLGYNYRMMDLQAAIGLAQLDQLNEFTEKRIQNAKYLSESLNKLDFVKSPYIKPNIKHVFHQYTIKVNEVIRDKLVEHLKSKGIVCGIYYPKPLHLHPFFLKMGYKKGDFPIAEKVSKQVISLPIHPALTQEDLDKIIREIGDFNA